MGFVKFRYYISVIFWERELKIPLMSLYDYTTIATQDKSTHITTTRQDLVKTRYVNTAFFLTHR